MLIGIRIPGINEERGVGDMKILRSVTGKALAVLAAFTILCGILYPGGYRNFPFLLS